MTTTKFLLRLTKPAFDCVEGKFLLAGDAPMLRFRGLTTGTMAEITRQADLAGLSTEVSAFAQLDVTGFTEL